MTTEQTRPDRDAIFDLEHALSDIGGAADVLFEMGKSLDTEAVAYLANRLQEHYEQAHAAFCIVSGLDGGKRAAAEPATAIAAGGDPLPAWVDEYFRLQAKRQEMEGGAEDDRLHDKMEELTRRIVDGIATTRAGLLAQLRLLRDIQEGGEGGGGWADRRNLRAIDVIAAGIERLGSGNSA